MNVSYTVARNVQDEMLLGDIHFDADTFKALLMRSGFSFSTTNHSYLINISTNTGAITYTTDATAGTITWDSGGSGSFVTDGFVANNYITTDDGVNTGTYKVTSVTATVLTATVVTGSWGASGQQVSKTITSSDEYPDGGADTWEYQTGGVPVTWTLSNGLLYLDPIPLNGRYDADATECDGGQCPIGFGPVAATVSPGFVIYDDTHADKAIVCYGRFSDWRVNV